SDIINCLSSGSWSDRRDGLIALQHLINNNRSLSRLEVKRVTDIFSRMFHDPHGKVFSVFLDSLILFINTYYSQLSDWLYVLLTRLLSKSGSDLLGSTQVKVQKALDAVRTTFSTSQQFTLLCKFLIDQTQSPNIKVKVSMLLYLHNLTQLMDAPDFCNTSDVRLAISRIITWTTEPKSVDVRKASQAVLLSLHSLNPMEFQVIMSVLPKTFQEGAERILQSRHHHHHPHSGHSSESQSLKDPLSPVSGGSGGGAATNAASSSTTSSSTLTTTTATAMNADDVYNSIRQTSQDIHSFVHHPHSSHHQHHHLPVKSISLASTRTLPTTLSIESRIPSFLQNLPDVDIVAKLATGGGRDGRECNGAIQSWVYQTTMMSVASILQTLSHHNEQNEQRKSCLLQLMKKCREETSETWDEYFDTTLLVLLETLTDVDGSIRALSLRVLSEFLRCHAPRFQEYVELTVVRSLEAHKDPVKEVTRAAEECSSLLSRIIPPARTHTILSPLIESDDYPINLAAIKMVNQIVEEADMSIVVDMLPYLTPSLLKAYENQQSSVRKSSVVCLVSIYMSVGEQLRPYLQDLHGSKVKLLNVYIKRALDQQGASSCTTSKTSSPTSVVEA
ncbi:hypothetical protein HELRODRAFT_63102, partial [Helobdella robusta]|uniref:TOG domain-containing protein n=1 Tax=Helobdella robusta TaxID=6412 RepID=T1FXA9_HELRO